MIMRAETANDAMEVARLGKAFAAEAGMLGRFSAPYAVMSARRTIEHPEGAAWLWRDGTGAATGVLAAQLARSPLFPEVTAQEVIWWVAPADRGGWAARALLTSFRAWARQMNADRVRVSALGDRAGRFLRRAGFDAIDERSYECAP